MFDYRSLESVFELRLRLFKRSSRSQPPHHSQPPHPRAVIPRIFRVGTQRGFECERDRNVARVAYLPCAVKARRRHTDDSEGAIVEIDLLSHNARVTAEAFLPVPVTQHRHGRSTKFIVSLRQHAPQQRLHTQPPIIIACRKLSNCHVGLSVRQHIHRTHITKSDNVGESASWLSPLFAHALVTHLRKRSHNRLPHHRVLPRVAEVAAYAEIGGGNGLEQHEAFRLFDRQLLEQHRIQDTEHRRIRADAQRQLKDSNRRNACLLHQHPCAVAQLLPYVCNHICPPIGSQHNRLWIGGSFNAPQSVRQ